MFLLIPAPSHHSGVYFLLDQDGDASECSGQALFYIEGEFGVKLEVYEIVEDKMMEGKLWPQHKSIKVGKLGCISGRTVNFFVNVLKNRLSKIMQFICNPTQYYYKG